MLRNDFLKLLQKNVIKNDCSRFPHRLQADKFLAEMDFYPKWGLQRKKQFIRISLKSNQMI